MRNVRQLKDNKEFLKWLDEIVFLFKLSRPISIPAGFALIVMGVISADGLSFSNLITAFSVGVPISYFLWSPNDYFDRESDQENDRKGWLFGATVTEEYEDLARHATIFSFLLGFMAFLFLQGLARWSLLSLMVVSFLYSVPPFRFRAIPLLDSIMIGLGAFLVFAIGFGIGGGSFEEIISGAYWFSLIAAAGNGVGTLPDIESDKKAGISTTGTLLGWRPTVILAIFVMSVSLYLEKWSTITSLFLKTQIGVLALLLVKPDKETWKLWAIGGSGIGLIFGIYWIFVHKLGLVI